MKITIIYDNTTFSPKLEADWGFSCLVKGNRIPTILFDTGGNGEILLSNMKNLEIDPRKIDLVFISHHHYDHTGGLSAFLNQNNQVALYLPPSFRGVRNARKIVHVAGPGLIADHVYSTGELEGIEQSMVLKTEKGLVLVTGCSHPFMGDILSRASAFGRVYAVVGGLHGFRDFELFAEMKLICAVHCTQYREELKALYPDRVVPGGAGYTLTFS